MSGKKKHGSGSGLQPLEKGLDEAAQNLKKDAGLKAIKQVGLPAFPVIEATEDKADKEQAIRNWISEAPKHIDELTNRLMICLDGDEVHYDAHLKEYRKVEEALATLLNPGVASARATALDVYGVALATHVPTKKWLILAVLTGKLRQDKQAFPCMVGLGLAIEVEKDTEQKQLSDTQLFLNDRLFEIRGKSARRITSLLREKIALAREDAQDHFRELTNKLLNQTDEGFNFEQLQSGKPGKLGFVVRDDKRGGYTFFGGVLLIQSNGKEIQILDAIGRFAKRMIEIRDSNRRLQVHSLKWEKFGGNNMPANEYKDLAAFWHVMKRSIESDAALAKRFEDREQFHKDCDEERKALAAKAPVSTSDWLINKSAGVAIISVTPFWEVKRGDQVQKFWFPSFLVERSKENKVKLAEFPERLKDLFQNPKLIEFTEPGDTNEKLAYPLGAMLRKAYAIESNKQRRNASSAETQQ